MINLYEKLDILKEELDELTIIKELEELELKIKNNSELYESVKSKDESITTHKDIIEYKRIENELNFLILEFNQKLKTITSTKGCHKNEDN